MISCLEVCFAVFEVSAVHSVGFPFVEFVFTFWYSCWDVYIVVLQWLQKASDSYPPCLVFCSGQTFSTPTVYARAVIHTLTLTKMRTL